MLGSLYNRFGNEPGPKTFAEQHLWALALVQRLHLKYMSMGRNLGEEVKNFVASGKTLYARNAWSGVCTSLTALKFFEHAVNKIFDTDLRMKLFSMIDPCNFCQTIALSVESSDPMFIEHMHSDICSSIDKEGVD